MAWPILAAAGLTAGAGLASTLINNSTNAKAQAEANEQNANLNKENRDFQERMSSTAHQREVADLRAAGLNPILSANKGASAPSGSVGTVQASKREAPDFSGIPSLANTAMDAMKLKQEQKILEAQEAAINTNTVKTLADTKRTLVDTKAIEAGLPGIPLSNEQKRLANTATALDIKEQEYRLPVKKAEAKYDEKFTPINKVNGLMSNILGTITSGIGAFRSGGAIKMDKEKHETQKWENYKHSKQNRRN